MNVLIILGHPRKKSFSGALADAYKEGAQDARMNVRQLALADMGFNPNVITVSPRHQTAEDDISLAQELILWADHLVFVYPTWWGTMPALLKGFMDRVFSPGFAFEEVEENKTWEKLLKGKSAQLITTMDTPLWVYRWIYKTPGHHAMGQATLQFCGINPVRVLSFSPIKYSNAEQRESWLKRAREAGTRLSQGILSPWEKFRNRLTVWLKAIRLQFYPMTWIAYAAGAYGAASLGHTFNSGIFWIGYLWLFLVEVATVLSNEYYDFKSDEKNKFYSPFTGGSRVIVEKELDHKEIRKGIFIVLVLSWVTAGVLLAQSSAATDQAIVLLLLLFVLALGYTVPPLKLSYRGLGELDVGITHSFGVILCGYIFQGGDLFDSFPWILSLPLFLGILPSIILAGIPDYEADKAASKNTIAVKLGRKKAVSLAIFFTILSAFMAVAWHIFNVLPGVYENLIFAVIPHSLMLVFLLYKYKKDPSPPARIDALMVISLTYILWFAIIPVFQL